MLYRIDVRKDNFHINLDIKLDHLLDLLRLEILFNINFNLLIEFDWIGLICGGIWLNLNLITIEVMYLQFKEMPKHPIITR